MNTSPLLDDFFTLSDICNDDLMIVAELIQFHHKPMERVSRIKSDVNNWRDRERLDKYASTIDKILSLPNTYVKTLVQIISDRTPTT